MKYFFCLLILFVFVGGLDSKNQVALLRRGPDIVIATPGRLVDHLHNAPTFSLHTVEIIVLDEADRWVLATCSHRILRPRNWTYCTSSFR